MMKKRYIVNFILFTLLFVIVEGCNRKENNVSQWNQSEEPVSTVSPIINEEKIKNKKKKIKSVTVLDEIGEKHKLKLGTLDETDVGVNFCTSDFIGASQISDGHYYYLHVGKGGKYTIYRDKKIVVGTFFVREGTVIGFVKVGSNYLAEIMYVEEHPISFDVENITYDIVQIDLATQSVKVLLGNCADDGDSGKVKINGQDIVFYRRNMYYDSRTDVQWEPSGDYEPGTFLLNRNFQNIEQEDKMICTKQMNEAKPYLTFVDGKILYGRQKGKEVLLYMFDLETKEQTEVVRYKRHKTYIRYATLSNDSVLLSVDNDYLYCQDMAIPRKGGRIQPLLKNALRNEYGGEVIFSSNKKCIFYIDKKYQLHRINKETGVDTLISKKKLMSVQCMERQIYVKELRHGYWDEKEEKRPDILYCMTLDGKIKWKHTLERQPETE